MRRYRYNAHSKYDMKVHLVWIPKYRKRVLMGQIAVRTRDLLRQVATENEIQIISGKVSVDHVHIFILYKPQQSVSKIMQFLKGTSSRLLMQDFTSLHKQFWGRHLWARGYLAVSSGTITDEVIQEYISIQEGEPVHDDDQFQID
ncbi:MAG: IS200/IS605 family transposase [Rickettsiales bacterium]|nr:IS200/IS605 family transposase [Rickettsiales bacterium]